MLNSYSSFGSQVVAKWRLDQNWISYHQKWERSDSIPKGSGFEPHQRHCVVSLRKNINPSLVLVQPRKTCPFITEKLLMGREESNQTKYHRKWLFLIINDDFLEEGKCKG